MRLIDADEYKEKNKALLDYDTTHPLYEDTVRDLIDDAPTIDAVEVVRCKDCRHWVNGGCDYYQDTPGGDWYCADGERRKENE